MSLREQYPLHPQKIIKKTIGYCIGAFFILFVFVIIAAMVQPLICIPILLAVPLGIYLWQKEYYKTYFYDLTDRGLEIKKGVFFPNSITIPVEKISDVYMDQDLLDRVFGLYDLHFSSASQSSGAFAHIDGMDKATTDSLRAYLMNAFKASQGQSSPAVSPAESAKQAEPVVLATFKPAPNGLWAEILGSMVGVALVLLFFFPPAVLAAPLLAIPVALFVKLDYESRIYQIRKDGIWIRKGWLTPSETNLFYRNIQDTDVTESILERIWHLQSINVKSMSVLSATSAKLTMLSVEDAKKMQEMLRGQIELTRSEGKQPKAAAAGAFSQPMASVPVAYSGPVQVKPFQNHFAKGRLVGSLPIISILVIIALGLFAAGVLFGDIAGLAFGFLCGIFLLAAIGIAILSYASALIDESTYSYSLGPDGLSIQLGLLSRLKKVIRFEKIQDIKLDCGFVESFFGLVSLHVETGSKDMVSERRGAQQQLAATAAERIPFLMASDAQALRAKLMGIAGISYPKGSPALREAIPLSPSKPLKKTVAWIGIAGIQVFIVSIALGIFSPAPLSLVFWGIAGLSALFFLSSIAIYKYEQLYMQKYFYDENEDTLVIRKGVFGWSEIVVPFRNIQSIYIDQDWYDVCFDLWDVWITTVTATSGPMAHIDGVSRVDAEKLARLLSGRVEKSRKK